MARAKYKHLLPREVRIWDAYLRQHGMPEGTVTYDVHLGSGAPVRSHWPVWMGPMVAALSRHRVDVIVERSDEVVIFELKGYAGMAAVGQLLGYESLWLLERGAVRPVHLVCVCESMEADMGSVFAHYDILVVVVGNVGLG